MDVFDVEWSHLYVWTQSNGSKVFLVDRNRTYYAALYEYLAKFWWECVIPAKRSLMDQHSPTGFKEFAPTQLDASHLRRESVHLAQKTTQILFNKDGEFCRLTSVK